ncbi:MAG: hypothetical protein LRY41_00715, partial [Candidatus Pacebacteria bacterium]|nr:hypothetical protein [Candidatus Paceibacterota bacterium]
MNTFWKKYIDITYRAIAYFGASIIGIYIIFSSLHYGHHFFKIAGFFNSLMSGAKQMCLPIFQYSYFVNG